MADDTKDRRAGGQTAGASQGAKRPYATLDLKATEVKITPVRDNAKSYSAKAARGNDVPKTTSVDNDPNTVPMPAPAWTYAKPPSSKEAAGAATAQRPTATRQSGGAPSGAADPAAAAAVRKRGGILSHLAAGIAGGLLAIAGAQWILPEFGIDLGKNPLSDDTAAIGQRLQKLETNRDSVRELESRLEAVEKSAGRIPALLESQTRLVADTKAALASTAGESGVPELLTRLSTVEEKLNALRDAGANDPNAGRIEQIAALTGKVGDLENNLTAQMTALRKSVAEDVEARMASLGASIEEAKSGTQRIDKDVASIKSEATLLNERVSALKTENDRLAASVKLSDENWASVQSDVRDMKNSVAKPADVEQAVRPLTQKLSALEASVEKLKEADEERRADSERVILSLELQNLKRALANGRDYAPELAAVKRASDSEFDFAALERFKTQGVPAQADLVKEFRDTANAAIDAEAEPAEGGVVDRLIAGAKSIVRVRKVNHAPDDKSTEAVVGRMETALKEGRYADVLEEAKALPPKAHAAAQPFLDRVAARASVDEAVAKIEAKLKTSLGTDPAESE